MKNLRNYVVIFTQMKKNSPLFWETFVKEIFYKMETFARPPVPTSATHPMLKKNPTTFKTLSVDTLCFIPFLENTEWTLRWSIVAKKILSENWSSNALQCQEFFCPVFSNFIFLRQWRSPIWARPYLTGTLLTPVRLSARWTPVLWVALQQATMCFAELSTDLKICLDLLIFRLKTLNVTCSNPSKLCCPESMLIHRACCNTSQ